MANQQTIRNLLIRYESEYHRTTGKYCFAKYHCGWFTIPSGAKVRCAEFETLLEILKSRKTVARRIESVNGVLTWIEARQHVVKNLLSGTEVIENRDTPYCCSVASEAYHSA